MKHPAAVLALCALALGACSLRVPLAYVVSSVYVEPARPMVGEVTATDLRRERDPTWIGAVRNRYGIPIKILHTPRPLADMVAEAFRQALTARGLFAPDDAGAADLTITIVRFQTSQYVRREADLDFVVELRNRATGQQLYRDEVKANPVEGHFLAFDSGIFGSPEKLQLLAQGTMNRAIDALIDKAAFAQVARNDR